MITIENLAVSYGATTVLDGVSLDVPEGQFLALVGPNGAGKTTLLRTVNGLLTPDSGRVTVDGEDVSTLSAKEVGRRVATVPQETSVAFEFGVEDVVAMGRTPHRSRFAPADAADREAVEAALERTDTAQFADRSIDSLSGGERQRVLLARALAQETPVLLLDEPTASLDINHQIRTLSLARDLADDGKTIIAAIHDLELAARFCDAMALLADGNIVANGPPENVLTAERLETAFDVRTAVATNPVTGTRAVTPLADAPPGERRVHVLGGGERAARIIGRLVEAGIEVSVGVLPDNDAALATARSVAGDVVTAPVFESVPQERERAARDLVSAADVTVLAAPVDGVNRTLAEAAGPLVSLPGTNPPGHAERVEERDLLSAVRDPPKPRSSRTRR